MAAWAKFKFFYETMLGSSGSTLTASSTASGDYSVDYIHNYLETNIWKSANATTPLYITYDAGAGNAKTADYIAILGHNLKTAGGAVTLEYSTDNFIFDINTAVTWAPAADTAQLKEFTSPGAKRYWRFKITGALSAAPYMTICIWGNKTELDYATASFDPYHQEVKAVTGLSYGGYVTGIHTQYTERKLDLKFSDSDSTLYNKIKAWWDAHGLKNFFVAWDTTNNPADIYLMRADDKFSNPFNQTGLYRDIALSLVGRKE